MKTTLMTLLAGMSLLAFAGTASAQYTPTGKDGITASPKLRESLDGARRSAPAPAREMVCARCKDVKVTRTDWTARGANKPSVTTVKHLCSSCDSTTTVTGTGKNATSTTVHSCAESADAKASCCKLRS